MLGWWLVAQALAAGPWAGIDPSGLRGLEPPVFMAPQAGWTADLRGEPGARVRVFVGRDVAEAEAWLATERDRLARTSPRFPLGDEAWGNGQGLMIARDGNVVVTVRRADAAVDVARQLFDALVEATPWPASPSLDVAGRTARVEGDWAQVTFRASGITDPATFLPRPLSVVPTGPTEARVEAEPRWVEVRAWDAFGRYADARWTVARPERVETPSR